MAEWCEVPVGSREGGVIRPLEDTAICPATVGQLPARPHGGGAPRPGVMEAEQTTASFHREAEGLRPRGEKRVSPWAC